MSDEQKSSSGGCLLIALLIALNLWAWFVLGPAIDNAEGRCLTLHARVVFAFDSLPGLICVKPVEP